MGISGAALASYAGTAAAVVGTASSIENGRQARSTARSTEQRRVQSEADAAQRAATRDAMRKRALSDNSLYTGGGSAGSAQSLGVG